MYNFVSVNLRKQRESERERERERRERAREKGYPNKSKPIGTKAAAAPPRVSAYLRTYEDMLLKRP